MVSDQPIRVAIIGLGFEAEFIPIYQNYLGAELCAICRRDRKGLDESGDRYGVETRFTDYRRLLEDPNMDAVAILGSYFEPKTDSRPLISPGS